MTEEQKKHTHTHKRMWSDGKANNGLGDGNNKNATIIAIEQQMFRKRTMKKSDGKKTTIIIIIIQIEINHSLKYRTSSAASMVYSDQIVGNILEAYYMRRPQPFVHVLKQIERYAMALMAVLDEQRRIL